MSYLSESFLAIKHQISVNYLKKMVPSLFTTKISASLHLKCLRYEKVNVLKLRKNCFNLEMKFRGPKIWELIQDEKKELESLWESKRAIKLWKPISYRRRLCK